MLWTAMRTPLICKPRVSLPVYRQTLAPVRQGSTGSYAVRVVHARTQGVRTPATAASLPACVHRQRRARPARFRLAAAALLPPFRRRPPRSSNRSIQLDAAGTAMTSKHADPPLLTARPTSHEVPVEPVPGAEEYDAPSAPGVSIAAPSRAPLQSAPAAQIFSDPAEPSHDRSLLQYVQLHRHVHLHRRWSSPRSQPTKLRSTTKSVVKNQRIFEMNQIANVAHDPFQARFR